MPQKKGLMMAKRLPVAQVKPAKKQSVVKSKKSRSKKVVAKKRKTVKKPTKVKKIKKSKTIKKKNVKPKKAAVSFEDLAKIVAEAEQAHHPTPLQMQIRDAFETERAHVKREAEKYTGMLDEDDELRALNDSPSLGSAERFLDDVGGALQPYGGWSRY